MDLSKWMTDLSDEIANRPLFFLTIPGSHDSLSYSITANSEVSPDAEPFIKFLYKFFGPIIRRIMYKWCVTQKASVTTQLNLGIRYFDIRVAVKQGDKNFYFVHGLYGGPIDGPLKEMAQFLDENPNEILIVDFQHFYNLAPDDHFRLTSLIENVFDKKLCPCPKDLSTITLAWMRQMRYQVIVIYRGGGRGGLLPLATLMWPSSSWPTPWPNTMSPSSLVSFLSEGLLRRPPSCGFVSQCVLTPSRSTVLRAPWAGLYSRCAVPASRATLPWLDSLPADSRLNVAISDFISDRDAVFPKTVIALNLEL